MSRYVDLLKQIPPDNEEISEVLLKKLNNAACALVKNRSGQYDLTEEERREYADYEPPEVNDRKQKWGLLDKWPVDMGDLWVCIEEISGDWCLGISVNSNPCVWFARGSKKHIQDLGKELNDIRETEGEEAFTTEIMSLIDDDLRRWD